MRHQGHKHQRKDLLGLYGVKTELEDLSLKYLNNKVFTQIVKKLSETKAMRENYIADFAKPIKAALDKTGLKYEIKGRTKTINSIWNKMVKKGVDLKEDVDRILYENDWDYDEIDFYEFAKYFFELGLKTKK